MYVETTKVWSQPYLFYEKNLNSIEIKEIILLLSLIKNLFYLQLENYYPKMYLKAYLKVLM